MITGMKISASFILTSQNVNWCIGSRVCPNVFTLFRFAGKFLISKVYKKLSNAWCFYSCNLPDLSLENTLSKIYVFKYVQAPQPSSPLVRKIAKIAKIWVFPQKLNRLMLLTHIFHQPPEIQLFLMINEVDLN